MIISFHIQGTCLVKTLVHSVARNKQEKQIQCISWNFHKITPAFYLLFISVCVCVFFFKTPKDLPYETHVGIIMFKSHFIK